MSVKYCLLDVSNLVHRAKHAVSAQTKVGSYAQIDEETHFSTNEKIGLVLQVVFNSIKKSYERFGATHCVACFDGRSWRRDVMPGYKANRRDRVRTPADDEEFKLILKTIDTLRDFMRDYTNVTVLDLQGIEADDFIGRWVQLHHERIYHHTIVSADSDFKQLVRPGVDLFIPLGNVLYTLDGVFFQDGKRPKKDAPTTTRYGETWKIKLDKNDLPMVAEPEWDLFVKCIRGDASDNIKSAWPNVPRKRIRQAFEARRSGDVQTWNNFINSTWGEDPNKQSVRERYEMNRLLIDLTAQPEEIKTVMDDVIFFATQKEPKPFIGAYFTKFCQAHGLVNVMKSSSSVSRILSSPYDITKAA